MSIATTPTEYVLNETTRTVHKHRPGPAGRRTACGDTRTLNAENLTPISVELATIEDDADRCGRCFEDAGGY